MYISNTNHLFSIKVQFGQAVLHMTSVSPSSYISHTLSQLLWVFMWHHVTHQSTNNFICALQKQYQCFGTTWMKGRVNNSVQRKTNLFVTLLPLSYRAGSTAWAIALLLLHTHWHKVWSKAVTGLGVHRPWMLWGSFSKTRHSINQILLITKRAWIWVAGNSYV